jgi:hypothetical protein
MTKISSFAIRIKRISQVVNLREGVPVGKVRRCEDNIILNLRDTGL